MVVILAKPMNYIFNVNDWLMEVIATCDEQGLSLDESLFVFFLFSSLDRDHVAFFKDNKDQVSSFSGRNVHIFTPVIYRNVIADEDWRDLRNDLNKAGIDVGAEPSAIFFRLVQTPESGKLEPHFFSAHRLPEGIPLRSMVRQVVESCIRLRASEPRLIAELARITQSPNLVARRETPHFGRVVESVLYAPRLFVSHSSLDKPLVRRVTDSLKLRGLNIWLDERELFAGDKLRDAIEEALRFTDVLLVFLSEHSAKSHWLQHEAAFFAGAVSKGRIIPVVLDDAGHELVQHIPAVQGLPYVDLRDPAKWWDNLQMIESAAKRVHHD